MAKRYPDIVRAVYKNKTLLTALRFVTYVCVALCAGALVFLLVLHRGDLWFVVKILLATGIPFLLVSAMRRLFNFQRPYEVYDILPDTSNLKAGHSFPSRHVFSAFCIGTLLLFFLPSLGIGILAVGTALAVCRVLLGIHFPRDVIAGALLGIVSSVIGYFVILL